MGQNHICMAITCLCLAYAKYLHTQIAKLNTTTLPKSEPACCPVLQNSEESTDTTDETN